jgi:isoprenylcysteine carboxyl methyltransferase (ICMT) family protein YpbQ
MELSTAQQIILIILAAALALLLLLAIVATVLVIRLLKVLRLIADEASKVVESAEAVGEALKKTAGPLGLLHFIQVVVEAAMQRKTRKTKR